MSRWKHERPTEHAAAMREWMKTPKGEVAKARACENSKRWRLANPERFKEVQRRGYEKMRIEALEHYGTSPPSCACCGTTELVFLTLDHIENDGAAQRRAIGMRQGSGPQKYKSGIGGNGFAYWLKKNGWPPGLQVLCRNCNWAKSHGGCPHQVERSHARKEQSNARIPLHGVL